jgi:hypothetical protein
MTKTPLSSDLDLVKEIEQLRIKQKLLLQAFKHKDKKEDQQELLQSISAQVQFLVEIFKEETSTDKDAEEETKNNQSRILDKIDSVKTAIFERMDLLEKKIDSIELKTEEPSLESMLQVTSEGKLEEDKNKISETEAEEVFGEEGKSEPLSLLDGNKITEAPVEEIPRPDFKVSQEEPTKKGWFSK